MMEFITIVTFIVVVIVSILAREELFPFSMLGMFAYEDSDYPIVLIRDRNSGNILSSSDWLGMSTIELSGIYMSKIADGETLESFAESCGEQLPVELRNSVTILLRNICTDKEGHVRYVDQVLEITGLH